MTLTEVRTEERAALLATLHETGPAAPTLCAGWTAADIAGHLVVAERAAGLPMVLGYGVRRVLPPGITVRAMRRLQALGDRQTARTATRDWGWLLDRLAAGPPRPYRLPSIAPIRLVEEWIHHEDVRRADGRGPRPSTPVVDDALWDATLTLTTTLREVLPGRERVRIERLDGRSHQVRDDPTVSIVGAPGELLLFLAGRTDVADVTLSGSAADVAALREQLVV